MHCPDCDWHYADPTPNIFSFNSPVGACLSCRGFGRTIGIDLRLVGVVIEVNGQVVATAAGAAVLGHPAASVAWLVRALARRGEGLTAGMTVLSGACTAAFAVAPGDTVVARVDRLGTVEVTCR